MAGSNEITIAMSSTEEDIRKLYDVSKMGSIQILNTLLQDDPNLIQKLSKISTSNVESPLHVSVSHGHLEFTRLLLDQNPELAAEVDAFQQTPLHLAATNGYLEIVRALLEKNTSACLVRDQKGLIPLHYAMINGQIELIQELIDARPQSVWMKLDNGQTVLHLCVKSNHFEGMKLLIERCMKHDENFLNTIDEAGNTILDMSIKLRQIEMVGYLLLIPKVKTGTTIENFVGIKGSAGSKKKMSKKSRRKRQKLALCWSVIQNKMKYKGDWVQEVRGIIMLVATVIATVTFQAGINPPGGVWQQDIDLSNSSNHIYQEYSFKNKNVSLAGTAIMSYSNDSIYSTYLVANSVSFLASVSVIMLIASRFPLKNRVCSMLMELAMFLAIIFLTAGYMYGIQMVSPHQLSEDKNTFTLIFGALWVWVGLLRLVGLWHLIRFLVWVIKSLWRIFPSKLKSYCFNITAPSRS